MSVIVINEVIMENKIQIFNNDRFGEIRVVDVDGKTYFVGSDVARSLGYTNTSKEIIDHCRGVLKWNIPTNGGTQKFEKRHVDVLRAIKDILQPPDNQVTQNCAAWKSIFYKTT